MGALTAVKVELHQEARKAIEYFESKATDQDRGYLSDEVNRAIMAARYRAAQHAAIESARANGGLPKGDMTEDEINALAIRLTAQRPLNGSH